VQDIEKLPLLLVGLTRQAMNRRKQGRSELESGSQSAILPASISASCRRSIISRPRFPRTGAQVPLKITHQDSSSPLLAAWQYGLGRAVVFHRRSGFAGDAKLDSMEPVCAILVQVVNWTMRQGDSGLLDAYRHRLRRIGAHRTEKADAAPISNLVLRVTGAARAMDVPMTQVDASLYRGDLGPAPAGEIQ